MASFAAIYYMGEEFRSDDFIVRLRADGFNQFDYYITQKSKSTLEPIRDSTSVGNLNNERVAIYNSLYQPVYTNPPGIAPALNRNVFTNAKANGEATFKLEGKEAIVISVVDKGMQYYIAASAFDVYGVRKMRNLKEILVGTLLGGLILSGLFAFFFVKQMVKPVNELNEQMKNITESNLDARVVVGRKNDELGRIARNFNDMLNRLQKAFDMQKNFVQHASHELRTPLASMLFQTEAALGKQLSVEEYRKVLESLREDQLNMSDLTNSLLLLSQYEALSFGQNLVPVRIDEVLYETIETIKEAYPAANISLDFISVPDNSNYLTIKGNEALVRTAIQNLIKNAFLYSTDNKVSISIDAGKEGTKIVFENRGQHLTLLERERLFIPFFRGDNSIKVKGTGLGLSIVKRIVKLHNGTIGYEPAGDDINRFTLIVPA